MSNLNQVVGFGWMLHMFEKQQVGQIHSFFFLDFLDHSAKWAKLRNLVEGPHDVASGW